MKKEVKQAMLTLEECEEIINRILVKEAQRQRKIKKLKEELRKLSQTGKLSHSGRFVEIMEALSILDPIDEDLSENILEHVKKALTPDLLEPDNDLVL